ncbi:MAG: translational GTPase TypA [Planctomycetota bacterium]|nr:translational GTPase TypA [Planctomycetota bacterium]MCX8039586.1 translational GTPase TypA [Planctomycetota bacterium]MDW8373123.1 translational GTPase TypA [Planctomycetota bacterium]
MTAPPPGSRPRRADVRNIVIIAHVDHGKTTLVDAMLKQAGVFRANQEVVECVLDSDAQERERGITILAKNCAVPWQGLRINIVDTPGHADFGGEVERVMRMADGALLLVDAFEGPLPQTRFVTRQAIAAGLKLVLLVNKIDKPGSEPERVPDRIFDLCVELGAADWQLDFPVLYGAGRLGVMHPDLETARRLLSAPPAERSLAPLFATIRDQIPGPVVERDAPLALQCSNIDHNDFVGRMAIGRIVSGRIRAGQAVAVVAHGGGEPRRGRVLQLHRFAGLGREEVAEAEAGDIVVVTGLEGIGISDTICDPERPRALPPIPIDEPTIRMTFAVSTSPLAGRDGKPLQSRELRARLAREAERNVALRVAETESADAFEVAGRGVLHLAVLIEAMRREGSEFQVGPPRVIFREGAGGERLEPIELAVIDVPEAQASKVMALMLARRAELLTMDSARGMQHLEFTIPARGLLGLRNQLLTATSGEATLHTMFHGYGPYRGELAARSNGAIIADGPGEVVAYALWKLQDRGVFFVDVGDPLYEGMVVGEHNKDNDLIVNLTKEKRLTNIRAAGADEAIRLTPPRRFSLEEALEYIRPDELVEVTPRAIRLRKAVLAESERRRLARQAP